MKTLMKVQQLLAANVKLARKRMGFSQMRLAELARLSTSFIGEIELGKNSPPPKTSNASAKPWDCARISLSTKPKTGRSTTNTTIWRACGQN